MLTTDDYKRLLFGRVRRMAGSPLKKNAAWTGSDSDMVLVDATSNGGKTILEKKMSVKDAKKLDELLGSLYDMGESNIINRFSRIEGEIKELQQEAKDLDKKWGKTVQAAKKLGIWPHYANGGSTMIPVSFQDPDGALWQIIDGRVGEF